MNNLERSCGAILFEKENGIRKYVLVMEASGFYGFPKGHKEGNESDIETATREIKEETGINPTFINGIKRTIRYNLITNTQKEVTYFVAKYSNQEFNPVDTNEILAVKKFELEPALNMLKYNELKNILLEVDYMLELKGE